MMMMMMMIMMTICWPGDAGSVVMTTVTLDRPFAYSTSTWHDNGCRKNVTKFLPVDHLSARSATTRVVSVDKRTYGDDSNRHEYLINSPEKSPHLTFFLPGSSGPLSEFGYEV